MSDKYSLSDKALLANAIGLEQSWGWSPAVDLTALWLSSHEDPAAAAAAAVPPPKASSAAAAAPPPDDAATEAERVHAAEEAKRLAAEAAVAADEAKAVVAAARLKAAEAAGAPPQDFTVLLSPGDIRHIFFTLAKVRRNFEAAGRRLGKLRFYVYEPAARQHARHLFFLQLLCDTSFTLGELEERTASFLELFGNATLREITAMHLKTAATGALRSLEKEEGALWDHVDLSLMKERERDFVETQMRFWTKDTSTFNVAEQWDARLRREMAERYDNKTNHIDWDFTFDLVERTHLIKYPEYRDWRCDGNAFDWAKINPRKGFKYEYTKPNKTLAFFDAKGRGVYQGDVKCGPFMAMGGDTANKHVLHRNIEGTVKYGNGVVAFHNVRAWYFELLTGKPWPWEEHRFAWDDPAMYNILPPGAPSDVEYRPCLPDFTVHLLEVDEQRTFTQLGARGVKFDAAILGAAASGNVPSVLPLMQDDGILFSETLKFVLEAKDEAKAEFESRVAKLAAAGGWVKNERLEKDVMSRQPPLPKMEGDPTPAKLKQARRYVAPYLLAFTKRGGKVAGAAPAAPSAVVGADIC